MQNKNAKKIKVVSKSKPLTIDDYISIFPENVKVRLEKIRETIRKTVPDAEETISYQIPAYKMNGIYLIYFAGWKNHVSIYPAPRGNESLKKELSSYKGGKGTIQLPMDKPLPLNLIKKIVKLRLKENLQREKIKSNKKR